MEVKLCDLNALHKPLKKKIWDSWHRVNGWGGYLNGCVSKRFERDLARDLKSNHCITVGNGTNALYLSLMALGVKRGDEVIVSSYSMNATAEVICLLGAKPVFVDVNPDTFNMEPELVRKALSMRTKAIMVVHLFGQTCNMTEIMSIARDYNIKVVEDCCQSIGAKHRNIFAGTIGDAGALSFYPTKNLGCFGDGGAVLTNSDSLAKEINLLKSHGASKKYYHEVVGTNSRLHELQACVLQHKLPLLDRWNGRRVLNGSYYSHLLRNVKEVKTPLVERGNRHVYHQYTIRCEDRDGLREWLGENDIQTEVYYPHPLHLMPCYAKYKYKVGDCPVAEKLCGEVLSLPVHPNVSKRQIEYVVQKIMEFYNNKKVGKKRVVKKSVKKKVVKKKVKKNEKTKKSSKRVGSSQTRKGKKK